MLAVPTLPLALVVVYFLLFGWAEPKHCHKIIWYISLSISWNLTCGPWPGHLDTKPPDTHPAHWKVSHSHKWAYNNMHMCWHTSRYVTEKNNSSWTVTLCTDPKYIVHNNIKFILHQTHSYRTFEALASQTLTNKTHIPVQGDHTLSLFGQPMAKLVLVFCQLWKQHSVSIWSFFFQTHPFNMPNLLTHVYVQTVNEWGTYGASCL